MRRWIALLVAAAMTVCLAGCSFGQTEETTPDRSEFKVGAIYITSRNDTAGYTFAHHNGIAGAMDDLGMDVDTQLLIVDDIPEDTEQVLAAVDTLVSEGANIIFGISFGYMDALEEAAVKYPDVIFSHATGYKSNETNFNNYFGRAYQARYLAGIVAGLKSLEIGNDNIGYVAAYGTEYAETASGINGFTLGVRAVNPDAVVYVKTLGTWGDPEREYAFAKELIEVYGCGVISQHCDSAQPQIAAEDLGVFGCGYNSDMTQDAPDAHLTAAIWNWDVYYRTAIETALNCTSADRFVKAMGGDVYYGGLAEGIVDISPLSENCADGTEKAIEKIKDLIVSGQWDVFSGIKLQISADGTITTMDDDLLDSNGNLIVRAGGKPIPDGIITGTMNYFVEGVRYVNE